MQISIRQATIEDAPTLTRLLCELNYFQRLEKQSYEETLSQVRRQLAGELSSDCHSIYVAEDENTSLTGYAAVHWLPYLFLPGPEGYVSELFISVSARSQGVGTRLLETIRQDAQKRGCTRLSLVNMRQRESYQRGFYKSRGWQERPEAANFILKIGDND